jgi:GNAT superfamily N-acetyltransferase
MNGAPIQVRPAVAADASAVAGLAGALAQSFTFSRAEFDLNYPALLAERNVCLLVATSGGDHLGYLLGFRHLTFFANGPVGWVEEILVSPDQRGSGTGRALMTAFEQWAAEHGCAMVALATRRAAPFYRAIGYEESAVYHRKILRADQGSDPQRETSSRIS